jgi:preprotein translocase subunit SecF
LKIGRIFGLVYDIYSTLVITLLLITYYTNGEENYIKMDRLEISSGSFKIPKL